MRETQIVPDFVRLTHISVLEAQICCSLYRQALRFRTFFYPNALANLSPTSRPMEWSLTEASVRLHTRRDSCRESHTVDGIIEFDALQSPPHKFGRTECETAC